MMGRVRSDSRYSLSSLDRIDIWQGLEEDFPGFGALVCGSRVALWSRAGLLALSHSNYRVSIGIDTQ